jgi:hypothetical protein
MDPLAVGPEGDEWYLAFTDENFCTYAPDDAPREVMEEALAIYLNMTPARQKEVLHSVQANVFGITGLSLQKCATFRWMRLAVAQLRQATADWYTDYLFSDAEEANGFALLRTGVRPPPIAPPREEAEEAAAGPGTDMDVEGALSLEAAGGAEIEQEEEDAAMELLPRADQELQQAALGSIEQTLEERGRSAGIDAMQRMASVNQGEDETQGTKRGARTAGSVEKVAERVRAAASGATGSGRRSRRRASASDEEAGELKGGGTETLTQLMVSLILRWRRLKTNVPTCANLNAQFAAHRAAATPALPAYGDDPNSARRRAQILFGSNNNRDFVFCKGVSTPNAPAGQAACDAALDWLAQKAGDQPAQLIDGKPYHFPHTHEVFRKILAEVYNPPRLADLAQEQEPTPAMSDLNRRFCYRTKGNSVDFESNAYKATVVVSLDHKGSTMTLDLDEFVLSDTVAAHVDTMDKLLTGTAPTDFDDATLRECVARDGKRYTLLHPAVPLRLHVYFQPLLTRDNFKRYFQLEMDPDGEGVLPIETVRAGDPYWRVNPETGGLEGCFFAFICNIPV